MKYWKIIINDDTLSPNLSADVSMTKTAIKSRLIPNDK